MARAPAVTIGQHSEAGRKPVNQDFHGAHVPEGGALALKGIALAVADGISSSPVSGIAAETAVRSVLTDYYCTPESWSVKTAAGRVIAAANAWLHAETRRGREDRDPERGWVCTFSALIVKGRRAHLFHVGDGRIHRLSGDGLERLTEDHRVVLSRHESQLARALGMAAHVEIDHRVLELAVGDLFVLTTDGVHGHAEPRAMAAVLAGEPDLDRAARRIAAMALDNGSPDNLTVQILRVDALPEPDAADVLERADTLPVPVPPEPPAELDGYRLLRRLHANGRSHVYLAADPAGAPVVLKVPSADMRGDAAHLRRLAMEEWVARRIRSAHVLKAAPARPDRRFLYVATEYVEGRTLRQWMTDTRHPDLETVRGIVEQIARGLDAFHRREMLHQDLRPENVMIDRHGTAKIIDFGSVRVAGVVEAAPGLEEGGVPGTLQYAAPEYFLGEPGTPRSDQFSLGVIAYEMLTGRLPYGPRAARAHSRRAQAALRYAPARGEGRPIPDWIDDALRTAVHPDPRRRHEDLAAFTAALRRPGPRFAPGAFVPLAARDPLLFWKLLSLALGLALLLLAAARHG